MEGTLMQRMARLLGVAVIVMSAAGAYAQGKDFTGKWTRDAEKTAAANPTMAAAAAAAAGGGGAASGAAAGAGGIPVGGGSDLNITMDAKTITVERGPTGATTKVVYKLDGSESRNAVNIGGQSMDQIAIAKWDGAVLVVTTKGMNGAGDTVAKYSMDGANLKVETQRPARQGGAAPAPLAAFYKKG